jgi:hypothetical protein
MMDIGLMENNTEKVDICFLMEHKKLASGKMGEESNGLKETRVSLNLLSGIILVFILYLQFYYK